MTWIIGIDEAGYGPNLGPFVMTSVACRVPDGRADADLWRLLEVAVRRHTDAEDERLLIADSKVVYSGRRLIPLECGVLASLPPACSWDGLSLKRYVDWISPDSQPDLQAEPWYAGTTPLPVEAEADGFASTAMQFANVCRQAQVACGPVRSVLVCPRRFNALLDSWGSKGAVLAQGLIALVRANWNWEGPDEPLCFYIDKHGGRNTYAAMLQEAIPEGSIMAYQEEMNRSVYQVCGLKREVQFIFQPRADSEHFGVALASMVSKYLREVLMLEFNRFWQSQIPTLKPTAGYPGDAARFFQAIRPILSKLGMEEADVWRRK